MEDLDKLLVKNGTITFLKENEIKQLKLNDDCNIEYHSGQLLETAPFSKLTIKELCEKFIAEGYTISDYKDNDNNELINVEDAKAELNAQIDAVDELQSLKDELEDKMAQLNEEKTDEKFPSTEFTQNILCQSEIEEYDVFTDKLTAEQIEFIEKHLGTIEEFYDALCLLFDEFGVNNEDLISIDGYVDELLNYEGGVQEWKDELEDMLDV